MALKDHPSLHKIMYEAKNSLNNSEWPALGNAMRRALEYMVLAYYTANGFENEGTLYHKIHTLKTERIIPGRAADDMHDIRIVCNRKSTHISDLDNYPEGEQTELTESYHKLCHLVNKLFLPAFPTRDAVRKSKTVSNASGLTEKRVIPSSKNKSKKKKKRKKQGISLKTPLMIIAAAVIIGLVTFILLKTGLFTRKAPELTESYFDEAVPGGKFVFGSYEQDNNIDNGTEKIEWIVLDNTDGRILAISRYCLDAMPFDSAGASDAAWETSTLRTWMNSDFYNTAFDTYDKMHIGYMHLINSDNTDFAMDGGNDTDDHVFLANGEILSAYYTDYCFTAAEMPAEDGVNTTIKAVSNIEKYEPLEGKFTKYAKEKYISAIPEDVYKDVEKSYGKNAAPWWTRAKGSSEKGMMMIDYAGGAENTMADEIAGIRPMAVFTKEMH